MVFGNPRPSGRRLARGDIINMEIAAGYRGYTAQIGSPICLGSPSDMVRRFWEEITLPAFRNMAAEIRPGNPVETIRAAGKFFREKGVQSRPIHAHGIDLVTDGPHVFTDGVHGEPFEQIFRPGMVFMAEPNPITADGNFGIFLGHTFIVTETGHECVDAFPWELVVV
jgi:Xaa-Pro aminopeptidase